MESVPYYTYYPSGESSCSLKHWAFSPATNIEKGVTPNAEEVAKEQEPDLIKEVYEEAPGQEGEEKEEAREVDEVEKAEKEEEKKMLD